MGHHYMRAKRDRRGSSARFHGDGPRDVTLEWSRRSGCGQQAGCSRRRATHGDSTKAIGAFVERSNAGRGLSRQPRPDLRPAVPGRDLAKENRRPLSCPPSTRAIAPPAAAPSIGAPPSTTTTCGRWRLPLVLRPAGFPIVVRDRGCRRCVYRSLPFGLWW